MNSALVPARRTFPLVLAWAMCLGMTLACCGAGLAAGADDWTALRTTIFRTVGEVNGTSVTAIAEDGDGYLWVGGQSGLSRWDGYRFRSYRPDPQVPDSIPDTDINVLHTDPRGRLWIGTSTGGLARHDRVDDHFVTYAAGANGLRSNAVVALADDGTGGLWIGTSGGLDHLNDRTGGFEHFRHDPRRPGSLPEDAVRTLLRDARGTLWVGTTAGLARRDPRTGRFIPVRLPAADGQPPIPSSMIEDGSGQLWIGTDRHGVYVIRRAQRAAQPLRLNSDDDATALAAGEVQAISEVRPGEIWFGTNDHGIAALDVATRRLRWLRNDPAVPTSLPQNLVLAIYRDRAGLAWVGTLTGLRRSDPQQSAISTVVVGSNRSAGIADSDVTAIFAAAGDRAWLGFVGQGVDIVDPTRGRTGSLRPNRAWPQRTLPEVTVRAIAGYPRGPTFIGTARGLYETDADGRGLRRIPMPGTSSDHIDSLCVIDGVLWIGTNAKGVWRLDRGAASPRRLEHTGLANSRITVIAPASPGHLWVGTYGGLNLLDVRSGTVERITAEGSRPNRPGTGFIASLLTDRQGRLWVGTFGEGILILDHRGPDGRSRFLHLAQREGLPNVNVDSMLADREGRIWVATDDGIAWIDPASLAIHALRRADGVEFSNYYLGARAMLGNGDVLFGSTGGLTIIRPALVRGWTYAPPIVVTDVRLGGRTEPAGSLGRGAAGPPIEISPDANSLSVEFAALDFSASEQNQYAYRLDGFDRAWNETDAGRRLAAYTNLPPGKYTLELRGSNRNGAWSPTLVVPIRVLPAWYQTLTFRFGEVVAAGAVLAGLIHIRTAYLRRRERDLEQQVDERTAELRALAIELSEKKAALEHIAYRDALTDLPNRRMFSHVFTRLLAPAGADRRAIVLLLIDLDRFKLVNDTLGHDAGDALLVEAANRLQSAIRSDDCVARLGGDEFAILLAGGPSAAEVDQICERIAASLALPIVFKGVEMRTSASIGIAVCPEHGSTQDDLYKSADTALYEAKRGGRDTWRRFAIELT